MKSTLVISVALALLSMSARAENSQQDKMKSCNAEANSKSLKGDDRKAFMSTCLSGTGH